MERSESDQGHAEFVPERVAALDPLGADGACSRLPELNDRCDAGGITTALTTLLPAPAVLDRLSYDECLAAMRDLGMFLASLQRHGTDPFGSVPGLEAVLVELGRRTDMIPRETIHHYTEMNPTGARQRCFTRDPMEGHAIDSVRIALRRYGTAVGLAERVAGMRPHDPEFAVLLNGIAGELGGFETGMALAHEMLPAEFFYDTLLPYYAGELEVGGETWIGPTAAHVPLAVIDMLVWESDHATRELAEYRLWALPYTMPRWRALRARWATVPSLATRVSTALAEPPLTDAVRDAARALAAVLRALVVFRGKHIAYARQGSSAEGIAVLRDILDQTRVMSDLTRDHY